MAGRKMLQWMMGNPTLPAQNQVSREPLPQSAVNPVGRLQWALLSLELFFFSSASYSSRLRSEGLRGIALPPSSRSLLLPYAGQTRSPFLHQPSGLTTPRPWEFCIHHHQCWGLILEVLSAHPGFFTAIVLPSGGQVKHCSPQLILFPAIQFLFCRELRSHLEKVMAPNSSTLAWKIPWAEEPARLQSMGSLGVIHDWATSLSLFTFMHWRRKWQPTPVFLPGESQGRRSLVGCHLWGCTESDTTEAT